MKRILISMVTIATLILSVLPVSQPVYAVEPPLVPVPPAEWPGPDDWELPPVCFSDGDDMSPARSDILGDPAVWFDFSFDDDYAYFRELIDGN